VTRENKASAAHWTAMKLQHGGVGAITRSDPFSCTDRSMDGLWTSREIKMFNCTQLRARVACKRQKDDRRMTEATNL